MLGFGRGYNDSVLGRRTPSGRLCGRRERRFTVKLSRTLLTGALAAGLAAVVGLGWPGLVSRTAYAIESGQASAAREQLKAARDLSLAFEDVAKAAKPSVVNIRSIAKVHPAGLPQGPSQVPEEYRDFFGEDFFNRFFQQRQRSEGFVQQGVGTGVIVSADGYILTNNHVVHGADTITVTLSDDRKLDGKVVGTDEKTDLAVVKIDAKDLLPAQLGDSDQINVGQWVLAVGNPFGFSSTVTAGIVSAKGRNGITDPSMYEDFIQTDAAINPGNSGGPLLNLDGQVIGINTAIFTRSGGYQGIGFAIPANMAKQVMESIIHGGKVVRGWLGVAIQNLTPELAKSFGYDGTEGALIGDVTAGSPAEKAGFKTGDILTEFGGKPVKDMNHFRNAVAATKPGTKADLKVFRDGGLKTLSVEIGELESRGVVAAGGKETTEDLGFTVQTLTPELATRLGYTENEEGVVVTAVEPGSLAERAGIQPKDIIASVGGEPVKNMSDFRAAMKKQDLAAGVRLQLKTEGTKRFVFIKR